jgi:hypothetical protein
MGPIGKGYGLMGASKEDLYVKNKVFNEEINHNVEVNVK